MEGNLPGIMCGAMRHLNEYFPYSSSFRNLRALKHPEHTRPWALGDGFGAFSFHFILGKLRQSRLGAVATTGRVSGVCFPWGFHHPLA